MEPTWELRPHTCHCHLESDATFQAACPLVISVWCPVHMHGVLEGFLLNQLGAKSFRITLTFAANRITSSAKSQRNDSPPGHLACSDSTRSFFKGLYFSLTEECGFVLYNSVM